MNFINPFELLDVSEADASAIKKAKRRKLAEFDLSDDGMIEIGNKKVTKSDFLRVADELDNSGKAEFYLFIKENRLLNSLLTNGDVAYFFQNQRQESIYNDADFINFISPYFAEQYNKVLLEAFQSDNLLLLKRIVANPFLVNAKDTDKAYRGLSQLLKNIENELHEIRIEIDNEESYYDEDTVEEIDTDLREKANNDALNLLPNYFQSQRNEIAQKIRNISVAVFNGINNVDVAFRVVGYSLEFNTNNLTKQKLQKDYDHIKEIYENRKESEQFSPELAKYASALLQIVQLIKQVENNQIQATSILPKVNSLFSVSDLNQLPNVFDEIKEQIAMAIRGLSVAVWNEKSDLDVSLGLIQTAQKINLKTETKNQINKAYNELSQLRDKQAEPLIEILQGINRTIKQVNSSYGQSVNIDKVREILNDIFNNNVIQELKSVSPTSKGKILDELKPILAIMPNFFTNAFVDKFNVMVGGDSGLSAKLQGMKKAASTTTQASSNTTRPVASTSSSSSNNGCMVMVIIGGVIALIAALSNSSSNSSPSYSSPTSSYSAPSTYTPPSKAYSSPTPTTYNTTPELIKESKYKGKKLSNGSSPFDACFGKGRFSGNAWLLFKNSNSSDAIVCLVSLSSGKTIRNEYIRAGSNFKMSSIPSGTYYLKVFYGNDWNPTLQNVCGTKGTFETDAHFSKSEGRSDWIEVENSDYSYTTGEITLYTVDNGNMSQSPINEQSFFNN